VHKNNQKLKTCWKQIKTKICYETQFQKRIKKIKYNIKHYLKNNKTVNTASTKKVRWFYIFFSTRKLYIL